MKELQVAYLKWLKQNRPKKLECEFEKRMKDEGFQILWTPPYCPKLQPIEVFWAGGKNHVADHYDVNTTMKDVVRRLQDGWYGNEDKFDKKNNEYTEGIRCDGLVRKYEECCNAEYTPLCPGLQGQIGSLTIDPDHVQDRSKIPIDSLVVDLTKDVEISDENVPIWL